MAKKRVIQYEKLKNLSLDTRNPRLGRRMISKKLTQSDVLDIMRDWTLDELAISFLESGFWPHEALIVTKERLNGKSGLVVLEGNRRIAALKYLQDAAEGRPATRKWREIAESSEPSKELFEEIPYIYVDSRDELDAFLGFRHVTGIKEWKPAEKAQYITKLIEENNMSYDEVRRKIGSNAPVVRRHYISYRLLLQMEDEEDIFLEKVEGKFSVLYLSLRTAGAQKYLHIDIKADEKKSSQAGAAPPSQGACQFCFVALWR